MKSVSIAVLCAVVLSITLPQNVEAGTIRWNGGAGNWSDPGKWDLGRVPQPTDTVFIDKNQGTYAVTLDVNATVANLSIGSPDGGETGLDVLTTSLTITNSCVIGRNGSLVLGELGTSTAALTLQSATTFINVGGGFVWHSGTLAGAGKINVLPDGHFNIEVGDTKTWDDVDVEVRGEAAFFATDTLVSQNTPNLTNHGLLRIGDTISFGVGTPTTPIAIINNGVIECDALGTATIAVTNVDNNNLIHVASGILEIAGPFGSYNAALDELSGKYELQGFLKLQSIGPADNIVKLINASVTLDGTNANCGIKRMDNSNALDNLAEIAASGALTLKNGYSLDPASPTFANDGALSIESGSTLDAANFTQDTTGSTFLDAANFFGSTLIFNGGKFSGGGNISGNLQNNGALISLGTPAAPAMGLMIAGMFTQTAGTLQIRIGPGNTDYGSITCTDASCAGTLAIIQNGYSPRPGDPNYLIVDASGGTPSYTWVVQGQDFAATNLNVFGDPLDFILQAQPKPGLKTWLGTVPGMETDWNQANNWSPSGVPNGTTPIRFTAAANFPVVTSGTVSCDDILMDAGSITIDGAGTLQVNGHVSATPGLILGTGTVQFNVGGPGKRIMGTIVPNMVVTKGIVFAGLLTTNNSLTIDNGGFVNIEVGPTTVMGSLSTTGTGVLGMEENVMLTVNGNANFNGGNTAGSLKGGNLTVLGNFSAIASGSYAPMPAHVLVFAGTTPQTLSLGVGNHLANVNFASPTAQTVDFLSNANILGACVIGPTSGDIGGSFTVTAAQGVTDTTAARWKVMETICNVAGPYEPPVGWQTNARFTNDCYFTSSTNLDGSLFIDGSGAKLDLGGHDHTVMGDLTVLNGGLLISQNLDAGILVVGNVDFAGGNSTGKLNAGGIEVQGNFSASGSNDSFRPTLYHGVKLSGPVNQVVQLNNPAAQGFQYLKIDKPLGRVNFTSDVGIAGDFKLAAGELSPGPVVTVAGSMELTANSTLLIDIDGVTPGVQFNQFNVAGEVKLGGTMTVALGGGFVPALNDSFKIIQFASSTGTFGTINGLTFGTQGVIAPQYNPLDFTLLVTASDSQPPGPPPSLPVITLMKTSNPTEFVNTAVNFNGAATQAESLPLIFTWDFGDGSATVHGEAVSHTYTVKGDYTVTLTVTVNTAAPGGPYSASQTLLQSIKGASSGGAGVDNVSEDKPPHVNDLSGISIDIVKSDGGAVQLSIDPTGLISRDAFDDQFNISTRFANGKDETVGQATGSKPIQEFTESAIFVATTDVEEKADVPKKKKGKGRKTIIISRREVGGTDDKPVTSTAPPSSNSATVTRASGKFTLPTESAATSSKPDTVQITATVELAVGIDLSKEFELSVAIGNIIDTVMIDPKGKVTKATAKGLNSRVKKIKVKLPKRKKGQSPLTVAGEKAVIDVTLSMIGMTTAGFETEGVSRSVDNGMINVQVGILIMGEAYESDIEVEFKKSKNEDSGAIRSSK